MDELGRIALRCPYDGAALDVETMPSGWYDDMPEVRILCSRGSACGAAWDTEGAPIRGPREAAAER